MTLSKWETRPKKESRRRITSGDRNETWSPSNRSRAKNQFVIFGARCKPEWGLSKLISIHEVGVGVVVGAGGVEVLWVILHVEARCLPVASKFSVVKLL